MKFIQTKLFLTICLLSTWNVSTVLAVETPTKTAPHPRLVVVLVIDQFRADYITRFRDRFIPYNSTGKTAGFEYLIHTGSYFPFAQYDILQSMTGPGHATILTGAFPYQMGIPINDWYDRSTHERVYCAEDQGSPTVGASPSDKHIGTSPKNLIGSTVGDELKNAGYTSKVVSIAIKDRASILLGGHRADLSLWLDKDSFQWVSSRFYLPDGQLPSWVTKLNQFLSSEKGKTIQWDLPQKNASGLSSDTPYQGMDDKNVKNVGTSFPHVAVTNQGGLSLPYGLYLTEKAAEEAVKAYQLGKNKGPDLLAISFSSHDYLGHAFGPNSREMEEMTVADDQTLSTFFNFLKNQLPNGLKDVVFVLTADHGVAPNPDWLMKNRVSSGRIDDEALRQTIENELVKTFGKPATEKYLDYVESLNFYFNENAFHGNKTKMAEAQAMVKKILERTAGIQQVFTSADYQNRTLPPGMFERQILHTYFPERNGDVIAIPAPFFFDYAYVANHMTGYNYDRTVPIIFAGPNIIKDKVFADPAQAVDIAPTLSYLLNILPPDMSEGRVLSEIIAHK